MLDAYEKAAGMGLARYVVDAVSPESPQFPRGRGCSRDLKELDPRADQTLSRGWL
jgi:hypothetical protein